MTSADRDKLELAYRQTSYWVETQSRLFRLQVDLSHPKFDEWLSENGATDWAYLTASNPASRLLPPAENLHRNRQLRIALAPWRFYPGRGVGDSAWYPEESYLVLDLPEATARLLARRFEQLAYVSGTRGQAARLVFVDG